MGEFSNHISNAEILKILQIRMRTINRVKKRFVEDGFEFCLRRKSSKRRV